MILKYFIIQIFIFSTFLPFAGEALAPSSKIPKEKDLSRLKKFFSIKKNTVEKKKSLKENLAEVFTKRRKIALGFFIVGVVFVVLGLSIFHGIQVLPQALETASFAIFCIGVLVIVISIVYGLISALKSIYHSYKNKFLNTVIILAWMVFATGLVFYFAIEPLKTCGLAFICVGAAIGGFLFLKQFGNKIYMWNKRKLEDRPVLAKAILGASIVLSVIFLAIGVSFAVLSLETIHPAVGVVFIAVGGLIALIILLKFFINSRLYNWLKKRWKKMRKTNSSKIELKKNVLLRKDPLERKEQLPKVQDSTQEKGEGSLEKKRPRVQIDESFKENKEGSSSMLSESTVSDMLSVSSVSDMLSVSSVSDMLSVSSVSDMLSESSVSDMLSESSVSDDSIHGVSEHRIIIDGNSYDEDIPAQSRLFEGDGFEKSLGSKIDQDQDQGQEQKIKKQTIEVESVKPKNGSKQSETSVLSKYKALVKEKESSVRKIPFVKQAESSSSSTFKEEFQKEGFVPVNFELQLNQSSKPQSLKSTFQRRADGVVFKKAFTHWETFQVMDEYLNEIYIKNKNYFKKLDLSEYSIDTYILFLKFLSEDNYTDLFVRGKFFSDYTELMKEKREGEDLTLSLEGLLYIQRMIKLKDFCKKIRRLWKENLLVYSSKKSLEDQIKDLEDENFSKEDLLRSFQEINQLNQSA
ncbi:hypothetical protein AB834_01275 [PVC group bacterium (ex Bugula neritina AB1)]|nr:hypothetical protein AB834_01275 [PVC group bacterium (ex Bugula neritina AB1)]